MQRVTSASSARVAPFVRVGEGGAARREIKRADMLFINHTCSARYTAGSNLKWSLKYSQRPQALVQVRYVSGSPSLSNSRI